MVLTSDILSEVIAALQLGSTEAGVLLPIRLIVGTRDVGGDVVQLDCIVWYSCWTGDEVRDVSSEGG